MKYTPNRFLGLLAAGLLLALGSGTAMAGGLVDTGPDSDTFNDATFSDPLIIDNPWWTLAPDDGYQGYLYFSGADGECEWNVVEVLAVADGEAEGFGAPYDAIHARVVLDRSWVDDACDEYEDDPQVADFLDFMSSDPPDGPPAEESTYDWYAQDDEQNIWYMGEDTYDGENHDGSFTAGCDKTAENETVDAPAAAGIVLLGDPDKGDFYQQEFLEGEAEDWGKVLNFIDDDDMECMKTKEWSPLESGYVEHKFYCHEDAAGPGALLYINEIHSKTVVVDLIASFDSDNWWDGQAVTGEIDPDPACHPFNPDLVP